MMNRLILFFVGFLISGCAAKLNLIDRTNGIIYSGTTDGTTMGGSGDMIINVEGENYIGPWIYQPNGGGFGFSNFSASTNISGSATAYNSNAGYTDINARATGVTSGSASSMMMSAVCNGMINVRAASGKFMRCVFTFHTMQNTGIGECLRNDGRTYDLTLKR
jgi:hypothetical protein